MTDRAKRGSNICGIATKSWPASDFNPPSAATERPLLKPSFRSKYAYTPVSLRARPEKSAVEVLAGRVCPAVRPMLSVRPPTPSQRERKALGGGFDPHTTGGTAHDHQGWPQDTIGDPPAAYPRAAKGDHQRRRPPRRR